MRYYVAVPVFLAAALLQTTVLPVFPVFGVFPNVVLVTAVCWTVVRGQKEGMVVVPMAGICLGLFDSHPVGVAVLAAAPVVLLAELREARITQSDFLLALGLVLVASLVYEMVFLVTLRLTGETLEWWGSLARVVLPTAVVNTLFAIPLYGLVWWGSRDIRKAHSL